MVTTNGDRLFVKTLSTDERSADILFRLYRRFRFKNMGISPRSRAFGGRSNMRRSWRRAQQRWAFAPLNSPPSDASEMGTTPCCWHSEPSKAARSTRSIPRN